MIRPDQYKVAQHLIDNPGDIIQLNMGLGKVSISCDHCQAVTFNVSHFYYECYQLGSFRLG